MSQEEEEQTQPDEQTQPLAGQLHFGEEIIHHDPDYLPPDNDLFKNTVRKAMIPPVKAVIKEVEKAPPASSVPPPQGGRRRSKRSYRKSHRKSHRKRKTYRKRKTRR